MEDQDLLNNVGRAGAVFEHATVKAKTDAGVIVHGPRGVVAALPAVSCLVAPEVGDRVLVTRQDGQSFVLGVLVRATEGAVSIAVSGEMELTADQLVIRGRETARISASERMDLGSDRLGMLARTTRIDTGQFNLSGQEAKVNVNRAQVVAGAIEACMDRLTQHARQITRRIRETEVVNVGNLVQRIRDNFVCRSKRTSLTARKDVHVDGERIHMG